MQKLIIHIHGFLSANNSERVQLLQNHIHHHQLPIELISPKLPNNPEAAIQLLSDLIEKALKQEKEVALIGHSMGGYFATWLATQFDLRAVLINPVVRGYEIMCEFFGECYNPHTDEYFSIGEEDIAFLTTIHLENINKPERFLMLQQLGDEITEPDDAIKYYQECQSIIEPDGCHDFDHFERHIETAIDFLFNSFD